MAAALHSGKKVPGYKLVEGRPGNRAWTNSEDVGDLLCQWGLEDKLTKHVLMSPTEAEKEIGRHDKWEILENFITRKPGAPCVTTADDKRPKWNKVTEEDLE